VERELDSGGVGEKKGVWTGKRKITVFKKNSISNPKNFAGSRGVKKRAPGRRVQDECDRRAGKRGVNGGGEAQSRTCGTNEKKKKRRFRPSESIFLGFEERIERKFVRKRGTGQKDRMRIWKRVTV